MFYSKRATKKNSFMKYFNDANILHSNMHNFLRAWELFE